MRAGVIVFFLMFAATVRAAPIDIPKKSVSLSRQFIVYCDDLGLRLAVSGFAETTKSSLLTILGQPDAWKIPIVVNVRRAETNDPGRLPSRLQLSEIEEGFKIQLDISFGADPREILLQQQLTRAILLELAYRDHPETVRSGVAYLEPPAWLIEGLVQLMQNREKEGAATGVFQSLIASQKLLPLDTLLTQDFNRLDSTSRQLYGLYTMSLLQLLVDLPEGRAAVSALLRALPKGEDATALLSKRFAALAGSSQSVEKWWSLGVARLAAADRYKGLSIQETARRLDPLLTLRLQMEKNEGATTFGLAEYKIYLKNPRAREALKQASVGLAALGASAHPLFRPVVAEYQSIVTTLGRGKTGGITERLEAAEKYRDIVFHRIDDIADYLNWFEGTQMAIRSDAFDDYLKSARPSTAGTSTRTDAISQYLDQMAVRYR